MDDAEKCVPQGWSLDSKYQPEEHVAPTARFHSLSPDSPEYIKSFIQAHTPPDFGDAPFVAVKTLLSFDAVSICEDQLLKALLTYLTTRANIPCLSPKAWTGMQLESVLPELEILLPLVRYLSLTTTTFLELVEPLDILSQNQLINKYRFDALAAASEDGSLSFEDICSYYKTYAERSAVFGALRGRTVILESDHPHQTGQRICHVQTSSWARRMVVEFDRRTCIGLLTTLKLEDAERRDEDESDDMTINWNPVWNHGMKDNVKRFVFDSAKMKVVLTCPEGVQRQWGWKLFARPIALEKDIHEC